MKRISLIILGITTLVSISFAQVSYWPAAGLTPRSTTLYQTNLANNSVETGDIAIGSNGNVLLAWEDDGAGLTDWEAIWTLLDSSGNSLTPPVTITNVPSASCDPNADSVPNCTYRAFFRSNGSPTPGYTGDFGGKGKANLFGDGFAFSSSGDAIACEVPELVSINLGQGDTAPEESPIVQLINNNGTPNVAAGGPLVAGIRSYSDADTDPAGNIRPADVEFLANGNFVIVGESRQAADQAMTGQASGNVVVYKVLNSTGGVVMPYTNGSSEAIGQSMWHGAAATANGFALRFATSGGRIRFFDNNGLPLTTNIDIAAVTGHPEAGPNDRGDGSGFKGNGRDAIVYAANSAAGPWVTVFNANGTVRYSRAVTGTNVDGLFPNSDRLDAAIAADGRVVVVFDASNTDTNNGVFKLTQARIFDPCGNPLGPVFYVSEKETATNAVVSNANGRPRVAWRGDIIAFMWASDQITPRITASRIFNAPPSLGPTIQLVSGVVTISWTGCGILQQSSDLTNWADITPTATSPYTPSPLATQKFYRLRYF